MRWKICSRKRVQIGACIIYIKMDKEHNLDNVSVIDFDNPYYDSYLDAYRDYMDENYNDMEY